MISIVRDLKSQFLEWWHNHLEIVDKSFSSTANEANSWEGPIEGHCLLHRVPPPFRTSIIEHQRIGILHPSIFFFL